MSTATQSVEDVKKTSPKKQKQTLPSFMKAAFSGRIDHKLIFPFPEPSSEELQEMDSFLQEFEKFCKQKINAMQIDEDSKIPQEILDGLAEFGIFSLTAPEEYDGLGISNVFFCRFMGLISRHCASVSTTCGAHLSIGSKGLYLFGTEEQKKKYIPGIISGETIAAFCLTEPQAGSDAHSIRTTAKLSKDGNHYVLNGEKIYITNGAFANFFTVFAKIASENEEESGFTAFIVTRDMGGVTSGKEEKKLGLKGSSTTPIVFNDVKVPVDNILGEPGKGFKIAMEILNLGRLGLAAACAGGVKRLVNEAVRQASERKQFGSPLSSFGLIQKKLARMGALCYAMNSSVLLTAGLADTKEVDFSIESAICKIFTTESTWEIVNETVQVFGGNGFIADFELERALRDTRVNMIFEGTNEILRLFIALTGIKDFGNYLKNVGKALNKPLKSMDVIIEYLSTKVTRSIAKEKFDNVESPLSAETKVVEKYIALLNHVAEKHIKMYKKDIIHQQFLLERMANMAIYIYVLAACISRIDTQIKKGKTVENLKYDIECLRIFSEIAKEQLEINYNGINSNYDDSITKVSNYMCEQQKYPFKVWDQMKLFNSLVAHTLPYVPKSIVGLVSKRYLAGETIDSAMATVKELNAEGAVCTIDLLGEFVTSESEVQETIDIYKEIATKIHQEKVKSSISLKPTSFGALFDRDKCAQNIHDLVVFAKEKDVQVTIDMEDHPYTDFTLEIYDNLRKEFPQHIRTVVQAYLKRTLADVEKLASTERCSLRLCKGIYNEPANIAYKDRNKVNENYLAILRFMIEKKCFVGIATHDDYLVYKAFEMIDEFSLTENDYEFQMLLGVRSELRKEILSKGHPLRIYIPFGKRWYEYSLRRLKENPNIAGNIIKGVLTFGR